MIIGIDGSRAFLKRRTGIEEYSYQVIRHLRDELADVRVILYIQADQEVDFDVPDNWQVKKLWAPRFWTQIRLSLEMLLHRPDVLFVPAHTVPLIHPKKTVVVVHGLEYEFCPKAYSLWSCLYMRWSIRFSCLVSKSVVCVSENTKRDVMRLYGTHARKIKVVYEGYLKIELSGREMSDQDFFQDHMRTRIGRKKILEHSFSQPYIIFIGRLEERKNIVRFVEAFELFKEKSGLPYKLVLVGKPGYGYERIQETINNQQSTKNDIIELGYVSEEEKWELLKHADVFLFATLYEGFGIPVLEAQASGVPVIASNTSSLPEVAGDGAILVDPEDTEAIAEAMQRLVSDKGLKDGIIQKGLENVRRFSWEQCAKEIAGILKNEKLRE